MSGLLVTPRWKGNLSRASTHVSVTEDIGDPQEAPPKPSTDGALNLERLIDCSEEVMSCQFNPSGTLLAVGLTRGTIQIYSLANGNCVHSLKDNQTAANQLPVTAIRFLPGRQDSQGDLLLATYAGGQVKFWHISTQTCVRTLSEGRQTLTVAISPSGGQFLTAGSTDDINVYDTDTATCVSVCQPRSLCPLCSYCLIPLPSPCPFNCPHAACQSPPHTPAVPLSLPSSSHKLMDGHRSRIFGLAFHPTNEESFISGGWDNTVQFWNTGEKHSLGKISGPHVCGDSLDIDPQTNQILIGSWRKEENLQVWDYNARQKIQTVPNDFRGPSRIYSSRWLGAGHMIAAGSDINMCRVIDRSTLMTRGCLVDLPGGVYSLDVSCSAAQSTPLIAVTSSQSVFLLRPTEGLLP
uniref:Anaphase-promoting complex subunit 4-like WD40 domain-containing protein n=2 Tax=Xenopus tropicalis TaxID=8364 RepID=A0A803JTC1_XENTR